VTARPALVTVMALLTASHETAAIKGASAPVRAPVFTDGSGQMVIAQAALAARRRPRASRVATRLHLSPPASFPVNLGFKLLMCWER